MTDLPDEYRYTGKQRRFIEEYCVDFNATQAAIRAGYSEKTAEQMGWENLRKPKIDEAIEQRLNQLSMSAAEATKRLTDMGRGSLRPFIRVSDSGRMHIDLTTDEADQHLHLIKEIKQDVTTTQDGEHVETSTKIKLHDAKDAIKLIGQGHGLFKKHHEIGGEVELRVTYADDD